MCQDNFLKLFQTVGAAAKQGSIRNTQNTISFVKRVLGRPWEDPVTQEYISKSPVKVSQFSSPGNVSYSVYLILRHLNLKSFCRSFHVL